MELSLRVKGQPLGSSISGHSECMSLGKGKGGVSCYSIWCCHRHLFWCLLCPGLARCLTQLSHKHLTTGALSPLFAGEDTEAKHSLVPEPCSSSGLCSPLLRAEVWFLFSCVKHLVGEGCWDSLFLCGARTQIQDLLAL